MNVRGLGVLATVAAVPLTGGAVALSAAGGTDATSAATGRQVPLHADLSGRNELDTSGRRGAGDPDGRGSFTGIIDQGRLCFGLTVARIDDPIAAHIHRGTRRESGPPVLTLAVPSTGDAAAAAGCVAIDPALARAIRRNRRAFYVNVHTAPFPAGAVRGQLARTQR